jgi:hypothetical protein
VFEEVTEAVKPKGKDYRSPREEAPVRNMDQQFPEVAKNYEIVKAKIKKEHLVDPQVASFKE